MFGEYEKWTQEHQTDVEKIVSKFIASLEPIYQDRNLSPDGQADKHKKLLDDVLATLDDKTQTYTGLVTGDDGHRIVSLEKKANVPLTPGVEEAALLLYQRDALSLRWKHQAANDIRADWQRAIDAGDQIAVRVFRDFAGEAIRSKPPWSSEPGADRLWPPDEVATLIAASDRVLMPLEQRQAADELAAVKRAKTKIDAAVSRARRQLEGARWDARVGKVSGAEQRAARDILKGAL